MLLVLQLGLVNPIGKAREGKAGKWRRGRNLGRDDLGKGIYEQGRGNAGSLQICNFCNH